MKSILRIAVSSLLIIYLLLEIDWHVIGSAFLQINASIYILSTLIALICPVFSALKYRQLIKDTSISLSVPRLIAINYISRFYALLIPSALGPEAVRWYKVTKNRQGRSFFLASTMLERIFFLLTLLAFGAVPLFFYSENHQIIAARHQLAPLLITAFLLLTCGLIFFIFPGAQKKLNQLILKYFPALKQTKLDQFLKNFEVKQSMRSLAGPLLALSLLWQFFFIARMFFLFLSLHLPLTFIDVTWMGSLVLLLQVLPISFAGIGVREGAYAYLFTLFNLPPEKGVLIGILFFTQMLVFSAIGAVLNLFET